MFVTVSTVGFGDLFPNWKECEIDPPSRFLKIIYLLLLIAYVYIGVSCMITILQSGGMILAEAIVEEPEAKPIDNKKKCDEEVKTKTKKKEVNQDHEDHEDYYYDSDDDVSDRKTFSHDNPLRSSRLWNNLTVVCSQKSYDIFIEFPNPSTQSNHSIPSNF